jgi:hypothetical protein
VNGRVTLQGIITIEGLTMRLAKKAGMAISAAALLGFSLSASAVYADGLGGITGWQPPVASCGTANIVPLLVANLTNESQTGSITIDGDLAEQVTINPYQSAQCPQRDGTGWYSQDGNNYTTNFTVPAGQTAAYVISMGGVDLNLITSSNTFSIGGDANGASNAQWYDFKLTLNADESFKYLQSYYSGTGGTSSASNKQNGFNILSCNPIVPTAGQNVSVVGPLGTPYSGGNRNGPGYGWGAAMCLGWLPDGEMAANQTTVNGGVVVTDLKAAQYNSSLNTVAAVVEVSGEISAVVAEGISLPQTPGASGGFWSQEGNQVVVEGVPAYANTTIVFEGPGGAQDSGEITVATTSTAQPPA